ncbi:MAG: hypothetical protein ABIP93_04805 [Gemmatimonadaceae bacterium]
MTTHVPDAVKRDLWLRLKHYHFDHLVPPHLTDHVMAAFGGPDAATRAFASKLSRKLEWTPAFARRAIEEYRKFVYLGMVSDVMVTPPKVIDQVWHEHLLFSRPYKSFCDEVLGRDFDHHPELVSVSDQTEVFRAQYEATLERYESEFNVLPPADIWGTPKFTPGRARVRRALGRRNAGSSSDASDGGTPLYLFFDGTPGSGGVSYADMPEFGGGGGFSGGGGGDSWGIGASSSSHSGHFDANGVAVPGDGDSSDSSSSDGASSDGGSSDGGSGCSSGCGGGGCGGGGE